MKRRTPSSDRPRGLHRTRQEHGEQPLLPFAFALLALSLSLSGCSSGALVFGTSTVVGTEVSGTTTAPTKVSIAYDRSEVALIPAKDNGETHSVYGGFDYDFSWNDQTMVLSQVFATGEAAKLASGPTALTVPKNNSKNQTGRLYFATGTRIGLSLDLGAEVGATVPSFLFGYKRAELTIIPIKDNSEEVNPVYADLSIVMDTDGRIRTKPKNKGGTELTARDDIKPERLPASDTGIRIVQHFATGQAALNAANKDTVRAKLDEAAGVITGFEEAAVLESKLRRKVTTVAEQNQLIGEFHAIRPFKYGLPGWEEFLTSLANYLSSSKGPQLRDVINKHLNPSI